jgi:non-ribosomal peptide synthetase component F
MSSPAGIATLVDRFQHVLEVMAADPAQRLSGVDVLDESEHAQLDVRVTGGADRAGGGVGVDPELFAAQGPGRRRRWRSAAAGRWTYRELDEASNRLAHVLAAAVRARAARGAAAALRRGGRGSWR